MAEITFKQIYAMKKALLFLIAVVCCFVANAQYKVGDIYDKDGVKGLVVKVDNTGEHGLIMSLDKFTGKWSSDKKAKFDTNAFYEDDGQKNMDAVAAYIEETGSTWSLFPFYEWCRAKGDGWYAPAMDEMKEIFATINGNFGKYNKDTYEKYDKIIKDNGGDSLYGSVKLPMGGKMPLHLLTSTEGNGGKVWFGCCAVRSPFSAPNMEIVEFKKNFSKNMGSRAVHKF